MSEVRTPHLRVTRHPSLLLRISFGISVSAMLTAVVASAMGLASKAFLASGYCGSVTVTGLPILLNALKERNEGQGIITGACYLSGRSF